MKITLPRLAMQLIALSMGNLRGYNPAQNLNAKSGGGGGGCRARSKAWKKVFGGLAVPSIANSRFA